MELTMNKNIKKIKLSPLPPLIPDIDFVDNETMEIKIVDSKEYMKELELEIKAIGKVNKDLLGNYE